MEEPDGRSFLREEVALRLWNLWKLGQRPDLGKFLAQVGPLSESQLVAVLRVDQTQRWKVGERVPVESYLMRFPAVGSLALELIYGECIVREELGETLSLAEYQQRFPQFSQSVNALGATVAQSPAQEADSARSSGTVRALPGVPTLPGFEIFHSVGVGGMGIVYKARQLEANRIVALKVIRPEQLEQVNALKRFEREVRAAVRLDHPNIVRFFEADQAGGQHYFVMEYVSGIDLQKLIEQVGPVPAHRACDFIRQAALGLQHAHDRGLVHRDIKAANIMVTMPSDTKVSSQESSETREGLLSRYVTPSGVVAKILDMGLARVISAGEEQESWSTLTVAGTFMGTPDYMAPEQWENPHAADTRTDIYSLGCAFYYLLTGQVPFPGGTLIQKLDKHRSQQPTPVEQLRAGLSPAIGSVLRKMMAKRPGERYQTPAEVAAALESLTSPGSSIYPIAGTTRTQPPGEVSQLLGHKDAVHCIAVAPNGKSLVSGGQDGTLRVWELATGRERQKLVGHTAPVKGVAYSPDGGHILTGSDDKTAKLWLAHTGKLVRSLDHTKLVKCVVFSADSRYLLTGCGDRIIRLWEVATGKRLLKFEGHTGDIGCVIFSPDGQRILSSSWDKTARLWSVKGSKELRCFGGQFTPLQWLVILGMAISPDGSKLAVGGSDNLLRVWDPHDGRELGQYPGHGDWITSVAFSRDGRHVLTGSRDTTMRLWDVDSGRELYCFRGHSQPITAVIFCPDGQHAFSSSADASIRYWRLPV